MEQLGAPRSPEALEDIERFEMERFKSQCAGKVRYSSPQMAEDVAAFHLSNKIKHYRLVKREHTYTHLQTYWCKFCSFYHEGNA